MANGFKIGGRTKGTKNKVNSDISKLARKHAKAAIDELATQMKTAPEKAVRVSAARELLDRAYGRPTQNQNVEGGLKITVKLDGSDKDL